MNKENTTPSSKPMVAKSDCCNADVITINLTLLQKISGDYKKYCSSCQKECTYDWKPMYELVSQGTYRKIVYPLTPQPCKTK